ncbi:sulfite exporter TauE/SafE family protein [Rhodococcus sp. KRD175]|uniref:sulfite exporter TauE/SafE family protein n=1 Tax=Rhodococcus sp. KRD175 TaxID=2729729 RepID=UPI0019D282C4|nr:sulfite exporter TauE/SafE family protein [Rhodococcus sp. KRD175]
MVATLAIAVAAGILIGLSLGALGGGGSILTVPALVYLLAVEPQSATSASLIIVGITSIIAAISHARARHVRWRAAVVFGILGSVTAFGGSILNRSVDPQILLLAFAALMIVAAGAMLRRTRRGHDADLPNPAEAAGTRPGAVAVATKPTKVKITTSQVVKLVASALVVGFLTGFLGVGGGFLIVPALVLALGYAMPVAVGTSLVIISITSAGAFTERLGTGATIPWEIVVPFTLAAIAGSFAGKVVSDKISATALTRSFAVLLLVVAVYVTVQASLAL